MGSRKILLVERELSPRDRAILTDLDCFHFLTSRQLQALHFHDHATEPAASRICLRVLARLAELRIIEHLDRRIGGIRAGSASLVWRVGPVGDRLLRQARGEGSRARRKEPSVRHLAHSLMIANCQCELVEAGRRPDFDLLSSAPEPHSWRRYLGMGGVPEVLKPDLYAVTATTEYEDHWFIEADRATESLPTILRKCRQYELYRRTGREQIDGGVFPLVAWVVPDDHRAVQVRDAIIASRELDAGLFRVTTSADFSAMITAGGAS